MEPRIVKGATFEIFSRPNMIFKVDRVFRDRVEYTWTDEDSETYYYSTAPSVLRNPELARFFQ